MPRRGRSRKAGPRFPSGKLRPVRELGNERVQAHRELYLRSGDVKATDDLDCALGQAHAAGLLEGMRVDGRVLLEHGKEWCRLYRATFGGGIRTRNLERIGRSEPSSAITPTDLRYRAWAEVVARLSVRERECLNLVCVEYGEGWALPPFLERLINAWKARRSPPLYVDAYLPVRGDQERLELLKSALLAIVEGSRYRKTG